MKQTLFISFCIALVLVATPAHAVKFSTDVVYTSFDCGDNMHHTGATITGNIEFKPYLSISDMQIKITDVGPSEIRTQFCPVVKEILTSYSSNFLGIQQKLQCNIINQDIWGRVVASEETTKKDISIYVDVERDKNGNVHIKRVHVIRWIGTTPDILDYIEGDHETNYQYGRHVTTKFDLL